MSCIKQFFKITIFSIVTIYLSGCGAMMASHGGMMNHSSHKEDQKKSDKEEVKEGKVLKNTEEKDSSTNEEKVIYKCPMGHYESDKPGDCPKCGMKLERSDKK
ncbi:MAG: heavy metal-binding domain-containing protein [Candidatus Firestonebacteria bacterium]